MKGFYIHTCICLLETDNMLNHVFKHLKASVLFRISFYVYKEWISY